MEKIDSEESKNWPSVFLYIPGYHVQDAWEDVEPLVLKALEKSGMIADFDPSDIREMCESREAQLWITAADQPLAVTITKIIVTPKRKILSFFLQSAEPSTKAEWMKYKETLMDFGRSYGCTAYRVGGRRGWARECGVKNYLIQFTEDLENA